jgi:hypothetical protein
MKYKVPCWNCDDGYVEPVDEWDNDTCSICRGVGVLIVSKLTDDNCDDAIPIPDDVGGSSK